MRKVVGPLPQALPGTGCSSACSGQRRRLGQLHWGGRHTSMLLSLPNRPALGPDRSSTSSLAPDLVGLDRVNARVPQPR